MSEPDSSSVIRLRGVRHNNLKNFDLDLPLHRLIVIAGLSGSGKSSLAFDTLYAEGQRRYIETFSPYARQFFDRMDKPRVDSVEGIPPAIAIEQRNTVRTTRSTVGTMTEICDYMKVLWPNVAQLHCRQCGKPVTKDSPRQVWGALTSGDRATWPVQDAEPPPGTETLITFDLPLSEKLSLADSLALVGKQGYQRLLVGGEIIRLEEAAKTQADHELTAITVIQDRIKLAPSNRARFVEACEQAYHFGKGKLTAWGIEPSSPVGQRRRFSNRLHCARCDIEYREPSPALFSFNHPLGACPTCKGFGRVITIDYHFALPDRSLTLAEGAVKPWRGGFSAECQDDMMKFCKKRNVPTTVPFAKLSAEHQRWVIEGDTDYGMDDSHRWPYAWYGIKGYFKWLESKSYKMHVRVLLSRYRAYTKCPVCDGARFQPDTLLYLLKIQDGESKLANSATSADESAAFRVPNVLTLADFYALPIRDALELIQQFSRQVARRGSLRVESPDRQPTSAIEIVLQEVRSRLEYLNAVGLGYLTLDRPTRSLSGGETERVNLTTCLGTRLVNTLFVLDEPSVGLHPRDTDRLVRILQQLRDTGNTVLVVEHEASVMRAADQIIDLGPGHGATGGQIVFQGTFKEILKSKASLTGEYLSRRKRIQIPERRRIEPTSKLASASGSRNRLEASPVLTIADINRHNLKNLSVEIPLNRFVCITGVSGSGKSTLVREVLYPAMKEELHNQPNEIKASDRIDTDESNDDKPEVQNSQSVIREGAEHLGRVVFVDQSTLGKTPRSNPAVYIGAFDDIREFFAQSEPAKQRGLNASAFSFNSAQGQCERCRGAGFEKIEMQFLSDVFIRCPDCNGRRYREHILEIKIRGARTEKNSSPKAENIKRKAGKKRRAMASAAPEWSIADLLDATVDEAIDFLNSFVSSKPAQRAVGSLQLLQEVGLGYLRLGQPINTLSGGENQRLKLVSHLAESAAAVYDCRASFPEDKNSGGHRLPLAEKPTLFLFDEPTTGLHFDDVRVLLQVFQRLVNAGHSVIVIEHNLDVIKCADWLIDLGPEAGDEGGQIVAQGTPEDVAVWDASHTGHFLREVLGQPERHVLAQR